MTPSPDDQLFVSQEDWWNNACLNWCDDGWTLYATGYREAADLLVRHIEERSAGQDMLVYPILFLYRQHLELEIKDLIRQARRLQDVPGGFPTHHDIVRLWRICHRLISEVAPNDSVEALKEIDRLIEEFAAVDPSSMAFRQRTRQTTPSPETPTVTRRPYTSMAPPGQPRASFTSGGPSSTRR